MSIIFGKPFTEIVSMLLNENTRDATLIALSKTKNELNNIAYVAGYYDIEIRQKILKMIQPFREEAGS